MEKVRRVVNEIAYSHDFTKLSLIHRSLIPLLSISSSLYTLSLTLRHHCYSLGIFNKRRLKVPVISVGNLTWGGNGKTPMVEYLARWFCHSGICPLILSRGYGGGDEVKMLERHLSGTCAKVGVGANRAMIVAWFLGRYGHVDLCTNRLMENPLSKKKLGVTSEKFAAAILDDGMQHISLARDLEIVMVNGLSPWGNNRLVPFGPLREPLSAIQRADIVVIHHADLVSQGNLFDLEVKILEIKQSLPIFFSTMHPSHFQPLNDIHTKLALSAVKQRVVLCVSAIGSPNAFLKCIEKLGPLHVDQLHFSDHHPFQAKDISMMKRLLEDLQHRSGSRPMIVTTEKDYDRDQEALLRLHQYEAVVLCSELQFMHHSERSEEEFKKLIKQLLDQSLKKHAHH